METCVFQASENVSVDSFASPLHVVLTVDDRSQSARRIWSDDAVGWSCPACGGHVNVLLLSAGSIGTSVPCIYGLRTLSESRVLPTAGCQ